jgi:hypothetical protein
VNAQFLLKAAITIALVLAASFLAKRHGLGGALVASLPLTSLPVLAWLYADTHDAGRVADLSMGIFWFVLGGMPFFVVLALALRHGWNSFLAFGVAALAGFTGVTLTQWLLPRTSAGD